MRDKLKFGEIAGRDTEADVAKNLAPVPARTSQSLRLELGLSVALPSLIANHELSLSEAEGSLITDFLIDTLPIRIVLKSFACIIGARSNRHSSEGPLLPAMMQDLANLAIETAKRRGASYADARVMDIRHRDISTKNGEVGTLC